MADQKKILHIANWLGMGGAEKLIAETLPRYQKAGLDTELLLTTDISTPLRTELEQSVKIHTLPYKSFYDIRIVFRLIPFFKEYDLIHVHLFPPQYFVVLAKILSKSSVPMVFTEHSTSNRRMQKKLFKLPERFVYKHYQKIICITDRVMQNLKEHIASSSKNRLTIIENGVDLGKIDSAHKFERQELNKNLKHSDVLLIQVSSFQEPKDQQTVIRALEFLPDHVKLILAGEGHLREESERLVNQLELQNRVVFLGVRTDVPRLLKTADFIILSSKYEGLSLSSVEGMACGRPFIAADVPGLREVVGGAGVLFPSGNASVLAAKISDLLQSQSYYDTIVDQCKERSQKYNINVMVEKHLELYKQLLQHRNP